MARIKLPSTGTKAKAKPKAVRVTAAHVTAHRENAKKDHSPKWENATELSGREFSKKWHDAMSYYRLEYDTKQCKNAVLAWMTANGYPKDAISKVRSAKDWRVGPTMGGIAACLNRGMPAVHPELIS